MFALFLTAFLACSSDTKETTKTTDDKTTTESETGASQYTDEQLLAAGWTHEQITQMRGN